MDRDGYTDMRRGMRSLALQVQQSFGRDPAVAQAMDISFGAAMHRYAAWQRAGGLNRAMQPLD